MPSPSRPPNRPRGNGLCSSASAKACNGANATRSHPIAPTAIPSSAFPCVASKVAARNHVSARASDPAPTTPPVVPPSSTALWPNPSPHASTTPATPISPIRTRTTPLASATTALANSPPGPNTTKASKPPNSSHTDAVPDAPNRFHHALPRSQQEEPPKNKLHNGNFSRTKARGTTSPTRFRSFHFPGMTRLPSGMPRRARRRFQRSPAEPSVLADTPSTPS